MVSHRQRTEPPLMFCGRLHLNFPSAAGIHVHQTNGIMLWIISASEWFSPFIGLLFAISQVATRNFLQENKTSHSVQNQKSIFHTKDYRDKEPFYSSQSHKNSLQNEPLMPYMRKVICSAIHLMNAVKETESRENFVLSSNGTDMLLIIQR